MSKINKETVLNAIYGLKETSNNKGKNISSLKDSQKEATSKKATPKKATPKKTTPKKDNMKKEKK